MEKENKQKELTTATITMLRYHELVKDQALIKRIRTVMIDDPTLVYITQERYRELNEKEDLLKLLEKEGLKDWDGYDEALGALGSIRK
jgi:hypothetical protein